MRVEDERQRISGYSYQQSNYCGANQAERVRSCDYIVTISETMLDYEAIYSGICKEVQRACDRYNDYGETKLLDAQYARQNDSAEEYTAKLQDVGRTDD
jgi:hypothetical protein